MIIWWMVDGSRGERERAPSSSSIPCLLPLFANQEIQMIEECNLPIYARLSKRWSDGMSYPMMRLAGERLAALTHRRLPHMEEAVVFPCPRSCCSYRLKLHVLGVPRRVIISMTAAFSSSVSSTLHAAPPTLYSSLSSSSSLSSASINARMKFAPICHSLLPVAPPVLFAAGFVTQALIASSETTSSS